MLVNKYSALVAVLFAAGAVAGAAQAEEDASDGKRLYDASCGGCHQADGGGVPMLQPELIGRPRANGPPGGVIDMILFGSDAMAENEGDYGNEMPAFSHLTDLEIAKIATYVRTHFENHGSPVTSDDVKPRRAR